MICVETRHMQAVLKAQINKTDCNDARHSADDAGGTLSSGACEDDTQSDPAYAERDPLRVPLVEQAGAADGEQVPKRGFVWGLRGGGGNAVCDDGLMIEFARLSSAFSHRPATARTTRRVCQDRFEDRLQLTGRT